MCKYLTDRIGNIKELRPYFPLWKLVGKSCKDSILEIIIIEHDRIDSNVPRLLKMTNGRALR
jgi:hypothetical protein